MALLDCSEKPDTQEVGAAAAVPEAPTASSLPSFYDGDSAHRLREAVRYLIAGVFVVLAALALAFALTHGSSTEQTATDVDDAVMVDLPPAEASSEPQSSLPIGPEQQPSLAAPAQQTPMPQAQAVQKAEQGPEQRDPSPPPPTMPDAAAPLPQPTQPKEQAIETPPPSPGSVAQDAMAPPGSEASPSPKDRDEGDEGRPHASKLAITSWQRSLLHRLQLARQALAREAHGRGSVKVAFAIDAAGRLLFVHVATSSGSVALDREAVSLVRKAAPFPSPPAGSGNRDTSFVVPIMFR